MATSATTAMHPTCAYDSIGSGGIGTAVAARVNPLWLLRVPVAPPIIENRSLFHTNAQVVPPQTQRLSSNF